MKVHGNYNNTGCPFEEIEFSFYDGGSYTVRPDKIGDTIFGSFAHKIMFSIMEEERRSGRNLHFGEKIDFIVKWSEDIANNPNGVKS